MRRLSNWIFPFRDRTEPTEHGPFAQPRMLGDRPAPIDADALRMIRRNNGRVHPKEIADALCWSLKRLKRVCAHARPPIRLTLPRPKADAETESREPEPRGA